MGSGQSQTVPKEYRSSIATGENPGPYATRRHPDYANGVLQLPDDLPNAQVFYLNTIKKFGKNEYIGKRAKIGENKFANEFTFETYETCYLRAKKFGAGLTKLGVKNASMVCIYSENRPEWVHTMDASYLYGFVTVSLYDTFTTDALEFSIKNCGSKYICVSRKNLSRLAACNDECLKQFTTIITFDPIETDADKAAQAKISALGVRMLPFQGVVEMGDGEEIPYPKIDPEQLLYVCYSSGTTGFPKGVMISHRCFITNLLGVLNEAPGSIFTRHLCYLPLCHVFERMCSSCVVYHGGKLGIFSGSVNLLTEDMGVLKPTVFIVVPRVLQRINDVVQKTLQKKGAIARAVFNTCWYVKRYCLNKDIGTSIVDKIVFDSIKRTLGGSVQLIVCGGAALPSDLHEYLQVALGIPIRSGYGLSEGGSGNVLNPTPFKYIHYGATGYPLANVEIRLEPVPEFTEPDVGEILMGGTGLCSGYLNDEEATRNLFTDDSRTWIHTGDIGKWDSADSLCIVDRLRSIFKLSQGEYVAGDLLSTFFEASELVSSIFVYGDAQRNYLVGIVIPDFHNLKFALGMDKNTPNADVLNDNRVVPMIMEQLGAIAKEKSLLGYQKVVAIKCVDDEWTIENGCLSPTFKAKRKVLSKRYAKEIEELYAQGRK
jgi:long-chain acyl-CoA synthetase